MKLAEKILINFKRSYVKLFKAKNILHNIYINKNYIEKYFTFNKSKNYLSDHAIKRIFQFAKNMRENDEKLENSDMWKIISSDKSHLNLLKYCLEENKESFLELMNTVGKSKLVWGFLLGIQYDNLKNSTTKQKKEATQILDKLLSLAEYCKVTKVHNPEQGGWLIDNIDIDKLISGTFKKNDIIPFKSPNLTFGISCSDNFYCEKDFISYYTSLKINKLIDQKKLTEVTEIGAGLGYVAYYVFNSRKIDYKIYDLPSVAILQAYFLMMSVGEENIYLFGETPSTKPKIQIYPYWNIFKRGNMNKILWFNQDSFPEIDLELSKKYIEKIKLSTDSFLFSINQEARNYNSVDGNQHTVFDLLNSKNTKLINRARDFVRLGYIEELYKL